MRRTSRNTNMTEEEEEAARFEKLPKWAQSRIRSLEDRVECQKDKIEELSSPHPESNVKVCGWPTYPDLTLPSDSKIEFVMGTDPVDKRNWRDKISVGHIRSDKGRRVLRIQGDYSLLIRCSASNCFEVTFDDR